MIDTLMPLIKQFMPFAQKKMGFKKAPKLFLKSDSENAQNPLGKTAHYDPEAKTVTIYITDRHPKDVMRSLSHELVHHCQNCRGDFSDASEMGAGYAQNDEHLRKMEREAYETGNMCFRDWEDSIKSTIYFEHLQKGEKMMSLKDWKNNELTNLLAEAWGFKFNTLQEFEEFDGSGKLQKEGEEEIEEIAGVGGGADDPRKRRKPHGTGSRVEDEEEQGEEAEDEKKKQVAESEDTGASKGDDSKTHKGEKDYTTKKGDELKTSGKGRGEKKGDKAYVNEDDDAEEDVDEGARGRRRTASIDPARDDARTRPMEEEEEIEEDGRRPRMQRQRQDLNSPVQNTRTTAPSPEEHGEDDTGKNKLRHPKVAKVAEGKMTKKQLRETLRTVLMSLTK